MHPEPGFRKVRCVRCGGCVEVCTQGAVSLANGQPVTDASKCIVCGQCVDGCLRSAREIIGRQMSAGQVMAQVEKDIIFYDESGGGVTFSGGEPLMQPDFLFELLGQCKTMGIHTAVDTTCYAEPQIVMKVAEKTDLFLCDIKHMDPVPHEQFTSVDNALILYNIRSLSDAGKRIVVRIPIIPGFNDEPDNIEKTAEFAASLAAVRQIDILPYNIAGKEKSTRLTGRFGLMEAQAPHDEQMADIAETLKSFGFEVKIGG